MNHIRPALSGIKSAPGVRIVGLGASAAGLEPLETFLSSIPARSGLAYLVVQHMDPTHEILLTELLRRATAPQLAVAVAMAADPAFRSADD